MTFDHKRKVATAAHFFVFWALFCGLTFPSGQTFAKPVATPNDQEERLEQACFTLLDTVTSLMEAQETPPYVLDLYYRRMHRQCESRNTRLHAIETLNSDLLKLGD